LFNRTDTGGAGIKTNLLRMSRNGFGIYKRRYVSGSNGSNNIFVSGSNISFSGTGSNITFSSNSNAFPKVHIEYVDEAKIEDSSYKLGIFNFFLLNHGGSSTSFEVNLDESALNPGSITTKSVGSTEMIITAMKGEIKQSLSLQGSSVMAQEGETSLFIIEAKLSEPISTLT